MASNTLTGVSAWFWEERVWLPPNISWADVQPQPDSRKYTQFSDLWYPIPAAFVFILVRAIVMRYCFRPVGLAFGIKDSKHTKPPSNDVLEAEFQRTKKEKKGFVVNTAKLAAELGMRERQVDYWFKKRRLYGKPTTMEKFCETGWRWLCYSGAFLYGLCCLWKKPWLWNIRNCWYDYPHHEVDADVWWYYMFALSFYWSLFISQFSDVKRKDFVEIFIHHLTTIALLAFSWTCNLFRCGTLVLVIHDFADIFLEAAKMCNYAKLSTACDTIFGIFAVGWIITRLGVFPTWILYSTTVEAPQMVEMFPAYYIFNGLLSVLLVLHVIWTYFIMKVAYNALSSSKEKNVKDSRSDSSEETCSTAEEDRGKEERIRKENNLEMAKKNGYHLHQPAS